MRHHAPSVALVSSVYRARTLNFNCIHDLLSRPVVWNYPCHRKTRDRHTWSLPCGEVIILRQHTPANRRCTYGKYSVGVQMYLFAPHPNTSDREVCTIGQACIRGSGNHEMQRPTQIRSVCFRPSLLGLDLRNAAKSTRRYQAAQRCHHRTVPVGVNGRISPFCCGVI